MNYQAKGSSGPQRNFGPSPDPPRQSTIGAEIRHRAEIQPDQAAVVSSGFAPLSYRELQSLIDRVRAALRLAGLGRNARIAVGMPNNAQAALGIIAVSCSAVSVPLNPRQALRETEVCLATLRPDAVLLMKGVDSDARQLAEREGLAIIEAVPSKEGTLDFSIGTVKQIKSTAIAPDRSDEPDPDAPAFILQTSGTAAAPKFIPFSHRNMLAAAARLQAWFDLMPQDRCLGVSAPYYSHGLKVTVFTPLLTGGTVAFPKDASKFDYAEWFEDLRPTWYSAGPTLHRLIFDQTQTRADAKTGHSLRFILSGGAPLPRNVLEGLQDTLGVPVVEHYGSSEAAQIAANLPPPGRSKVGTCGIPWPDTVRIVDEDGRPLPAGQQGEILVGGPTLTSGYVNAPELNRESFIDGWFKTGDIGSLDEDGFLTLHGRKNDVINRGGEKISPVEIDDALIRHPAVAEAAAFSVPHSRLGEDVAAAVVLRAGMTATPLELRRFLQDKVASFKIPRQIFIRDQLPKGITGKIQRRLLTETVKEDAAADVSVSAPPPVKIAPVGADLTAQLIELWKRLLNCSSLSLDDNFFEMGGDSLLATTMLAELGQLTGQTISSSVLFEAPTVRQLVESLAAKNAARPKTLIQLPSRGRRAPLFFFHGDYNRGGFYAARLANRLGSEQPLIVVAPHGVDNDPIPRSIEAMATDRLPSIIDAQPSGPYRLCGYCVGGLVAFEVARMLVTAGKQVEMVGMIDPPTINARRSVQFILATLRLARPFAGPAVEDLMAKTWTELTRLDAATDLTVWERGWRWLKSRAGFLNDVDRQIQRPVHVTERDRQYVGAMLNYNPKPLPTPVPVVFFSADYSGDTWRRISPELEIIKLPGGHDGVSANVGDLADQLRARLELGLKESNYKKLPERRAAGVLRLTLNGRTRNDAVSDNVLLLDYLREMVGLTGTKTGCDGGECGACTVLIDGEPRLSCLTLASSVDGRRVDTIESLAIDGHLSAVQRGFHEKLGSQCGYCTPGFIMASAGLLQRNPRPNDDEIREALGSNICRCTGYVKIVEAVKYAADLRAAGMSQ